MSFENAKLAISGGYASPPYFDAIRELAATEQPVIAFDTSPRVTQEDYDTTREMFTGAFNRMGLPEPIWLQEGINDPLTRDSLERSLEKADVMLVTGGATKHAYEKWQAAGLTENILEHVLSGDIVAAGGSAGAMIWFSHGYSDSMSYEVPKGSYWNYVVAQGAGLFKSWVTAHHSDTDEQGRDRRKGFVECLEKNFETWEYAVGLDTGAALICTNGIATVKDVTIPKKPASHDVYIYDSSFYEPRVLTDGSTIKLTDL